MKQYRIIAGASAAVLALGLQTACGSKQEPVVEEEPVVQEEALEAVAPEAQPEDVIVEFPLEEVEPEAEEQEAELPEEAQPVLVAELMEIAEDGALIVLPYVSTDADMVISDYADVDLSAFEAGEETEELVLGENVLFQTELEGELTDADQSALEVGAMLVIVSEEDGAQTIVIHSPVEE